MGHTIRREDREDRIEMEGTVVKVLPQTIFEVQVGQTTVQCTLSGKLRQNRIRILEGDRVKIEVSPYDLSKGRCVWRY